MFNSFFNSFLNSRLFTKTLSDKFNTTLKINLLKNFLDHPIGAVFDLAMTLIEKILHTKIQ